MTPQLSIVIPTYNERARIVELVRAVFAGCRRHGLDSELVIVDDDSPDGTGDAVAAVAPEFGARLRLIRRRGERGLGTAVMTGFRAAHAPIVGVMDADFSHPPDALIRLHAALQDADVDAVVGSRYVPGGAAEHWPVRRLVLSRVACALARPLTPVRDATSGFFLVRRERVQDVQIQAGGFKICLELLVRGRVRSVAEVPYVFTDRTAGESKMSLKEALGYLVQLVKLARYRLVERKQAARSRYVRFPAAYGAQARVPEGSPLDPGGG